MREVSDLSFPYIDIDRPAGTDFVSQVDDYERETRAWFVQCLRVISGYPNIDSIAVKVWEKDEDTHQVIRPDVSYSDKVVLGFNPDTNELEVLKKDGNTTNVVGVGKQVALFVYPVGSYYETSDPNFNPETEWGGTWELDSQGRVMVSKVDDDESSPFKTVDATGGEEKHCLARPELPSLTSGVNEMPIHYHPHRHPHTHPVVGVLQEAGQDDTPIGYLSATQGTGGVGVKVGTIKSDLPIKEDYAYSMKVVGGSEVGWFPLSNTEYTLHGMVDADTLNDTEYDPETHEPTRTISKDLIMHVGSKIGQNGHNNLQPYKVCIRWHRTA